MAIETTDSGCWIDGHWGQYGTARLVDIATALGFSDPEVSDVANRHLASMGPSDAPDISDDEFEILTDGADKAEEWLNDHAPDGYAFGWSDGEFFLWSVADWDETMEFEPDGWAVAYRSAE